MNKKLIKKDKKPKVIVILGPTASGKTRLAVDLALEFNGEIISADSRQVYKGMDIGTGKDLSEYKRGNKKVFYHLIDVASPKRNFDLKRYQRLANKAIFNILKRGKLPIIVGGSGLYIQAIIDNYDLPAKTKDKNLRLKLESLGADKLFELISKKQPDFAQRLNNSDRFNARRLARYLEVINSDDLIGGQKRPSPFSFLIFGVDISDDKMRVKIKERLDFRLDKQNMITEVKKLRKDSLSDKRLINFGLEYKFITYFLQGKINNDEMRNKLMFASYRFAKRQKTWFRRFEKQGGKIHWIKNKKEARVQIIKFLKNPA